jgi:hypothetical protein
MVEDTAITIVKREFKEINTILFWRKKNKQTQYWKMRERFDGKAEMIHVWSGLFNIFGIPSRIFSGTGINIIVKATN